MFIRPLNYRRICCLIGLATTLLLTRATAATALKIGDPFPDLTTFKLEGQLPDALKGKVVLIDFWASWCVPCRQSFPVMEELQKQYGPKGLVILAINVDEKPADMANFLKKNPVSLTILRDAAQALVAKTEITTMPSSFIIDRAGKVRFAHSGFHGKDTQKQYETEIESLLQ